MSTQSKVGARARLCIEGVTNVFSIKFETEFKILSKPILAAPTTTQLSFQMLNNRKQWCQQVKPFHLQHLKYPHFRM